MKRQTPKVILLLLAFYGYQIITGLARLFLYASATEYHLFTLLGYGGLYFGLGWLSLLLAALTFWFLWKPRPVGFWIALADILVRIAAALLSFVTALNQPQLLPQAYQLTAQARNEAVSSETVAALAATERLWLSLGLTVGLNLVIAGLIIWKKDHFSRMTSDR
jgi:hypothetical protein